MSRGHDLQRIAAKSKSNKSRTMRGSKINALVRRRLKELLEERAECDWEVPQREYVLSKVPFELDKTRGRLRTPPSCDGSMFDRKNHSLILLEIEAEEAWGGVRNAAKIVTYLRGQGMFVESGGLPMSVRVFHFIDRRSKPYGAMIIHTLGEIAKEVACQRNVGNQPVDYVVMSAALNGIPIEKAAEDVARQVTALLDQSEAG